MDTTDRQLLEALQNDARVSYAELGRRVGLTPPAVAERVRRLETSGIIAGYHAQVDLKKAGYGLVAFIRLSSAPELGFVLKVAARSIEHLEKVIMQLLPYGQTTTSIVLSSPVTWRRIELAES